MSIFVGVWAPNPATFAAFAGLITDPVQAEGEQLVQTQRCIKRRRGDGAMITVMDLPDGVAMRIEDELSPPDVVMAAMKLSELAGGLPIKATFDGMELKCVAL